MNILEAQSMTQKDVFIQGLRRVTLVDTGYILSYDKETNTAKVQASSYEEVPRVYNNVEVLFYGSAQNGIKFPISGSACLLFMPRSSNKAVGDYEVTATTKEYTALKCMPVFTPTDVSVVFAAQEDGSWLFDSDVYDLAIREDSVCLSSDDGKAQEFWSPTYKVSQRTVGDITWEDITKSDGSREITQTQGSTVLNKISIGADGVVAIESANDVAVKGNVNVEGDVTISGNFSAAGGNLTAEV